MKGTPSKKPSVMKPSKGSLAGISPREPSYVPTLPSEALPGFPSPVKRNRPITQTGIIVPHQAEGQLPVELVKQMNNGARQEVATLERWTHEQLANIHSASSALTKEQRSTEQIKVLDTSAELLAKMVEVHCVDKAQLLRKLWSSSADLFHTIYTELATVIHDLKLNLSEKNLMCSRLEDTIERLHNSIMHRPQTNSNTTSEESAASTTSTAQAAQSKKTAETTYLSEYDAEQYRALQKELILKNQEMMQLQDTLTSLSIWFPNFAKFNTSVLSKYLPPVDYLEQLELERRQEEQRQREAREREEEQRIRELSGKSGKFTPQRSRLNSIGEDTQPAESAPTELSEEDRVQLAQDYLLRDLKRLQGLGVGFAVLDPTEYEACKAVIAGNLELANSAGVFAHNSSSAGGGGVGTGTSAAATATMRGSGARQPIAVPAVLTAALSRTSVAVRNKFRSRSGKIQSFVEVKGDEYTLGAGGNADADGAPPDASAEGGQEEAVEGVVGEGDMNDQVTAGNAIAAAAAAVRKAFEADAALARGPTAAPAPPSPNVSDLNVSDYYKLQNVRVSKVDAADVAGSIMRIAADISRKRKPNYYAQAEGQSGEVSGTQSPPDDGGDDDADHLAKQIEAEYETKYRALLIDAQKLELAKASAETKMREEAKAHNKQLLRLSAQITTLQNKLQQSTQTVHAMLSKIPHVVFSPMIPRFPASYRQHNDSYPVGEDMHLTSRGTHPHSRSARSGSHGGGASGGAAGPYAVPIDYEETLFDDSQADYMSLLLNNTRQHRVKFDPDGSQLQDRTVDSFTADMSKLSVQGASVDVVKAEESAGVSMLAGEDSVASKTASARGNSAEMSLADVERIVARFCMQFTRTAPVTAHNAPEGDDKPSAAGLGVRDELYALFGMGPDQWTHNNLLSVLNGQPVGLFSTFAGDVCHVPQTTGVGVVELLQKSAFASHLLQFLCTFGAGGAKRSASTKRTKMGHKRSRGAVRVLKLMHRAAARASNSDSAVGACSPFVACLRELFCLPSPVVGPVLEVPEPEAYLCGLTDIRQRNLRSCIYFDLYLQSFQAMQRFLAPMDGPRSFPVSTTDTVLRRIFTVIGEESPGSAATRKTTAAHKALQTQSAPWWRCLTARQFATLKHAVEITPVTAHRAAAVRKILSLNRGAPVAEVQNLELEGQTEELRVDCYECIAQCMKAVEDGHRRLMDALMYIYRFLASLSLRGWVHNRTFHLLLAHILQQAYPSVQEAGAGLSISAVASGNFSFAPKTAIVVNLELMAELQALDCAGQLSAATFADAVLRSQPNFLVHGLLPLLEPAAPQMGAVRSKLIADGSGHLFALKEMIRRAYRHQVDEHSAEHGPLPATLVATAAPVPDVQSPSRSKGHKTTITTTTTTTMATGSGSKELTAASAVAVLSEEASPPPSHFKQSYLINKLLYPNETDISQQHATSDTVAAAVDDSTEQAQQTAESVYLMQTMVDYAAVLDLTESDLFVHTTAMGPLTFNPFVERLLLHGKLSFDEKISGVMAPSLAQVTLTTWTLQYVVETLSRVRGASMRLKNLFKRDMRQFTYNATPAAPAQSPSSRSVKPSAGRASKMSQLKARSQNNMQSDIGSIGDYVLIDFLLAHTDLDIFAKVEAHYIWALQRRVFRAWSVVVEDRTGQFK